MRATHARRSLLPLLVVVSLLSASCGEDGGTSPFGTTNPERAKEYIRGDRYTRLVLEVDYVEGLQPTQSVQDELVAGLEEVLDKPGGIEVVLDEELSPRGDEHAWDADELSKLARERFDLEVDQSTIKMHVLYVDGHDARDDDGGGQALGVSWANQNIVVYKQRLEEVCETDSGDTLRRRGLVERVCNETELIILTHEVGHVIGLVNFGLPMVEDHEDAEHEYHDHNEDCVMYWAFERRQAFEKIGDRFIDDEDASLGFDAACLADIEAVKAE